MTKSLCNCVLCNGCSENPALQPAGWGTHSKTLNMLLKAGNVVSLVVCSLLNQSDIQNALQTQPTDYFAVPTSWGLQTSVMTLYSVPVLTTSTRTSAEASAYDFQIFSLASASVYVPIVSDFHLKPFVQFWSSSLIKVKVTVLACSPALLLLLFSSCSCPRLCLCLHFSFNLSLWLWFHIGLLSSWLFPCPYQVNLAQLLSLSLSQG